MEQRVHSSAKSRKIAQNRQNFVRISSEMHFPSEFLFALRFRTGLRCRRIGFVLQIGGEDEHRLKGLGGGRSRRRRCVFRLGGEDAQRLEGLGGGRRPKRIVGNIHAASAEKSEGENIRGQSVRRNRRADVLIQGRNSVRAPVGDPHFINGRIPDKQQSATDFVDVIKVVIQVRRKGATDLAKPPIRSRSGLGTGNIDLEGSDKGCICIGQSPGIMVEMSFARNRNDRI